MVLEQINLTRPTVVSKGYAAYNESLSPPICYNGRRPDSSEVPRTTGGFVNCSVSLTPYQCTGPLHTLATL